MPRKKTRRKKPEEIYTYIVVLADHVEADTDLGLDATLFYDQRDTFVKPFQTDLTGGMTEFSVNPTEIIATVDAFGPQIASVTTVIPAGSTYFTNYLLTQLRLTGGTGTEGTTTRTKFSLQITESRA